MRISNQYAALGTKFSSSSTPEVPKLPQLLLWNEQLADDLKLNLSEEQIANYFSGQKLIPDSTPVAMAYSGHQFGHFNPQLGDGRAHLLGEVANKQGKIQEIQLKGSGQTPFSRNGDGKCGIKPAVREYIMSEAMHAMGVPTTRCLAVITTGEEIHRQTITPGAVVTRLASSHIRVGTFEYFAARSMQTEIKILVDLTIKRHYPNITLTNNRKYLSLLQQVIDKQIELVIEWTRVGFIHGVMNTDNTLLSGETIDYGPCAMMGVYDPETVFSSIDRNGRYAFGNQANIAQWNMARLTECFLNLIDEDEKQAINLVMPLIEAFPDQYNHAFNQMMSNKIGFEEGNVEANKLHQKLLSLMFKHQLDYTQTFVQLQESLIAAESHAEINSLELIEWHKTWQDTLKQSNISHENAYQLMANNNPVVIPRNHHIEKILEQVEGDLSTASVESFLAVLQSPYSVTKDTSLYQDMPPGGDLNYQTYCGT